jgi:hypothetical protein
MPAFKFSCPRCNQQIQCDTGYAGTQINCPACRQPIDVPRLAQPVAAPAAPANSKVWRNVLITGGLLIVLAALVTAVWFGNSMFTRSHLPPGLVGLWSGEAGGNDLAGGSKPILTDISFAAGKVGRAFYFEKATSAIKIPARESLNVGAGPGFTVMAWINPSDLSQRNEIFEWNNGATDQVVTWGVHMQMLKPQELNLGAGNLFADVHNVNGSANQIMAKGGTITANTFQHVALTYDKASGIARLFCNGKIVAEKQFGRLTPQTSDDFYIGRRPAGDGSHSFSGLIDEPALFNRALSPEEIQAIYTQQK